MPFTGFLNGENLLFSHLPAVSDFCQTDGVYTRPVPAAYMGCNQLGCMPLGVRMGSECEKRLEAAFADAERRGLWLVPSDGAQKAALRLRVARGELVRPIPGCFARAVAFRVMKQRQKTLTTIKTLAALHPNWVFCSYSAAIAHGLWVANSLLRDIHVVSAGEYGRAGDRVIRHRNRLAAEDIASCQGVRVTSLARTLMDCLCEAEKCLSLPIVDAALHWGLIEQFDLVRFLEERGQGKRGICRARETPALADGRSGSALESFARAVIIELGFQVPELQVEIYDPLEPDNLKYGDFGWCLDTPRPIIGEADGLEKYAKGANGVEDAVRSMSRERRREAHINLTNAVVVRFSYEDVLDAAYFERLLEMAGVPRA